MLHTGLKSFGRIFELGNFEAETDALFAVHTKSGVIFLKIMLDRVIVFFQIDRPNFFFFIVFHFDINSAFAYVRIDRLNLFAKFFLIVHGSPFLGKTAKKLILRRTVIMDFKSFLI